MRCLLDTHVFIWLLEAPQRLGDVAARLAAPETELLVSAVVGWELAIKHGGGKLRLPEHPAIFVPSRIERIGATAVGIEVAHATGVADLPPIHRGPFDRLLVAQARALDATLVTADPVVARYPVDVILV